jgi:tRNA(Ile)-lysidine synthase
MLERIDNILQHKCLVDSDKSILLGFSGGPDSLALMDIMHSLGYPLIAAHLDHGLRPESESDARAAAELAASRDIACILGKTDAQSYASDHAMSIEEAARSLRYGFLFRQARELGVHAVAVGHTANDQVETLIMHLLRGSGLSGLSGMRFRNVPNPWSQDIPLIRPILGIWRREIEAYIKDRGLLPLQDRTNLDTRYFRNRIRHELIPYLEGYNPGISPIIWRMADIMDVDDRFLQQSTHAAWEDCLVKVGPGYISWQADSLRRQHLALQRRILRRGIAWLRPGIRDLDYLTTVRGVEFINNPTLDRQVDLASGLRLFLEGGVLFLAGYEADLPLNEWPQIRKKATLRFETQDEVSLDSGWIIIARPVESVSSVRLVVQSNDDPYQAWIDVSAIEGPLTVRARRPGDRFKPLGLGGHSLKLSEFMINEKLPRRARDKWPLVCRVSLPEESGGGKNPDEIVWIPGSRLAHTYRIKDSTRKAAHLHLSHQE